MITRLKAALALGVLFAVCAAGQRAQQTPPAPDEYQVKAAFVYNFARFVEWPTTALGGPADPFTICVLGRNPFGNMLDGLANGNNIDGHPFVVRQISEAADAGVCKILFISSSERLRYRAILGALRGGNIFSVGDTDDFISGGGVAGLRLENGKVRIQLSTQAARENSLHISSRLLSLAQNVR